MNAREFRIGNFYQAKSPEKKEYEPKYRLDSFSLCQAINNEINLKPIPINDDWLVKLGFKLDFEDNYWINLQTHYLELIKMPGGCYFPVFAQMPEASITPEQRVSLKMIKNIHQLQNLYFILTGEELEIKK